MPYKQCINIDLKTLIRINPHTYTHNKKTHTHNFFPKYNLLVHRYEYEEGEKLFC